MGGSGPPAVLQSQDRVFLSGEASAEEPIFRGCLAQRIPEETPAPGGEPSAAVGNIIDNTVLHLDPEKRCHISCFRGKEQGVTLTNDVRIKYILQYYNAAI